MKLKFICLFLLAFQTIAYTSVFAMEPETIYQDENVLVEKLGQNNLVVNDYQKVVWRTTEIQNTEISQIGKNTVVLEVNSNSGQARVLYPCVTYHSGAYKEENGYNDTQINFYDYKENKINQRTDLYLVPTSNFSEKIITREKKERLIAHVFNTRGQEISSSLKIEGGNIVSAPDEHYISWVGDEPFFSLYSTKGEVGNINFEVDNRLDNRIHVSRNGKNILFFNKKEAVLKEFTGKTLWKVTVNASAFPSDAFITGDGKFSFVYYSSRNDQQRKIYLINNQGEIINVLSPKHDVEIYFFESNDRGNFGYVFVMDEMIAIQQYFSQEISKPKQVEINTKTFSVPIYFPGYYPLISTNDGKNIFMMTPPEHGSGIVNIIKVTIRK